MTGWAYDPMSDTIRAERERQVVNYQMERQLHATMRARHQEQSGSEQSQRFFQLWHSLRHRLYLVWENL